MPRDRAFERAWLERRGAKAANPEFAIAVVARLERATIELGEDSFLQRTLGGLCVEIDEEALDIAGWGVLAQQLPAPPGASTWAVGRAKMLIDHAADLAALASALAREAAALLPPATDAPA